MSKDTLLMVADSDHDANMLYGVRMFVPDPFIYLRVDGKCHVIMSDLEIDRARKNARHCKVLSLTHYQEVLKKEGKKTPNLADIIKAVLKERRLKKITVPHSFPHGLARQLRDRKIKLRVVEGVCFPQREFKTPEEVKKISAA